MFLGGSIRVYYTDLRGMLMLVFFRLPYQTLTLNDPYSLKPSRLRGPSQSRKAPMAESDGWPFVKKLRQETSGSHTTRDFGVEGFLGLRACRVFMKDVGAENSS